MQKKLKSDKLMEKAITEAWLKINNKVSFQIIMSSIPQDFNSLKISKHFQGLFTYSPKKCLR